MFCVNVIVYNVLLSALRENSTKQVTKFGLPVKPKNACSVFIVYRKRNIYASCHAGGRWSKHSVMWSQTSLRLICSHFNDGISFPTDHSSFSRTVWKFKSIAWLPHCVGSIDGNHISWLNWFMEQQYRYKYYKVFTSLVLFAVCTVDWKVPYAQAGKPEVLGDSTFPDQSSFLRNIQGGK